jgi:hypothetical protein
MLDDLKECDAPIGSFSGMVGVSLNHASKPHFKLDVCRGEVGGVQLEGSLS